MSDNIEFKLGDLVMVRDDAWDIVDELMNTVMVVVDIIDTRYLPVEERDSYMTVKCHVPVPHVTCDGTSHHVIDFAPDDLDLINSSM